ncbi:MAG: NAD(P)-binding domain-containing protein, partial [Gammaproteobacteria bacterium]|nr:NAD(P)-binding domain-containing protein [Gammaproteobacteria bacterium]
MSDQQHKICVLGAGSWGTALAIQLARNGNHTVLWGHRADEIRAMQQTRENRRYLPGSTLPAELILDTELNCIEDADDLLIVVPSHAFRETLKAIAPHLKNGVRISWATKGLEQG